MKKIIILLNTLLAFSLMAGCTSRVEERIMPMGGSVNEMNEYKTSDKKAEEPIELNYTVVKEDNAAVKKAAKEEAERKAREEAERKAREEAERIAAEEARRAEEERKAQESYNSGYNTSNTGNNSSSNNVNKETSNKGNNNTGYTQQSGRAEDITVRGISVYISSSVSNNDYDTFINWINNMPSFLLNNVSHIKVVDNIASYNPTGADVSGFANGNKIYVKASGVSGRKGTLYHEAAHILDRYNGYSETSTWRNICSAEWSGEGHYSSANESFAEAVSRYYVDGLSKSQSKAAIKNLVNTGNLGSGSNGDGFEDCNITLYGGYRAVYLYSTPSDRVAQDRLLPVGSSVQAIGVNSDGSWYKISYEGKIYYTPSYLIQLNP